MLVNKYYVGLDYSGLRLDNFFAHLLVGLPSGWTARDAIAKWRSPFWESADNLPKSQTELPRVNQSEVISTGPDWNDLAFDPLVAQYLEKVIHAYLSLGGDRKQVIIAAPCDTVAALIRGLIEALPATEAKELYFSTYENLSPLEDEIAISAAKVVGTTWLPGQVRAAGGKPELDAALYGNSHVTINCYTGKISDLDPDGAGYAHFAALTLLGDRKDLDEFIDMANELGSSATDLPSLYGLYSKRDLPSELTRPEFLQMLKQPIWARRMLCQTGVRERLLACALQDDSWWSREAKSAAEQLRDRAQMLSDSAPQLSEVLSHLIETAAQEAYKRFQSGRSDDGFRLIEEIAPTLAQGGKVGAPLRLLELFYLGNTDIHQYGWSMRKRLLPKWAGSPSAVKPEWIAPWLDISWAALSELLSLPLPTEWYLSAIRAAANGLNRDLTKDDLVLILKEPLLATMMLKETRTQEALCRISYANQFWWRYEAKPLLANLQLKTNNWIGNPETIPGLYHAALKTAKQSLVAQDDDMAIWLLENVAPEILNRNRDATLLELLDLFARDPRRLCLSCTWKARAWLLTRCADIKGLDKTKILGWLDVSWSEMDKVLVLRIPEEWKKDIIRIAIARDDLSSTLPKDLLSLVMSYCHSFELVIAEMVLKPRTRPFAARFYHELAVRDYARTASLGATLIDNAISDQPFVDGILKDLRFSRDDWAAFLESHATSLIAGLAQRPALVGRIEEYLEGFTLRQAEKDEGRRLLQALTQPENLGCLSIKTRGRVMDWSRVAKFLASPSVDDFMALATSIRNLPELERRATAKKVARLVAAQVTQRRQLEEILVWLGPSCGGSVSEVFRDIAEGRLEFWDKLPVQDYKVWLPYVQLVYGLQDETIERVVRRQFRNELRAILRRMSRSVLESLYEYLRKHTSEYDLIGWDEDAGLSHGQSLLQRVKNFGNALMESVGTVVPQSSTSELPAAKSASENRSEPTTDATKTPSPQSQMRTDAVETGEKAGTINRAMESETKNDSLLSRRRDLQGDNTGQQDFHDAGGYLASPAQEEMEKQLGAPREGYRYYVVRLGDTLHSIAETELHETHPHRPILDASGHPLTATPTPRTILQVPIQIKLVQPETLSQPLSSKAKEASAGATNPLPGYRVYQARGYEYLMDIARREMKNGALFTQILGQDLKPATSPAKPGTVLFLPKQFTSIHEAEGEFGPPIAGYEYHIVAPNENLERIIDKWLGDRRRATEVLSTTKQPVKAGIFPGQVLLIPRRTQEKSSPSAVGAQTADGVGPNQPIKRIRPKGYRSYIWRKGDNLWRVAEKMLGSHANVGLIERADGHLLDAYELRPGDELWIPPR